MAFVHSRLRILALASVLAVAPVAHAMHDDDHYDSDHDGYKFAATRQLSRTDTPTLLKATILPLALVMDIVFLPVAALADAAT